MPEATGADHHTGRPRIQQRDRLAHRVVGGDPRVGQRRDIRRLGRRIELHAGPRRGQQEVGHPAVVVAQAREKGLTAVHVVAGPAGPAQPAGGLGMQDHRVADGDVGDRRADLMHPAGVLVADRVGQLGRHLLRPLPLDDV